MGLYVWMRNLASCVLYKHISKDNMSRMWRKRGGEREREREFLFGPKLYVDRRHVHDAAKT